MIRKITFLFFSILFLFKINLSAQNCLTLGGPFTFGIPCGATCTNFTFKVPQIKTSEDYSLKNIGYTPQTYVTATGNEITSIYIDDQYSATLNLPFNVCMYGQTFNQFIVGSNGVMAFDLALSGCKNGYTVPNNIPFEGTASCTSITGPRYPKFSIMSPYHDIDPSVTSTSPNRKIEWRIDGTAPCRRLVVSFYQIPMFSCTSLIATSQIVVYENSAIIDIYVGNKPLCSSWQSGRAILGIQKDATQALAVPGHNATDPVWSETNTGYRFTPNGITDLLQSVTITKKDGTPVGTGTIGISANDSTTITYNNYCLTGAGPDTLVVKANYNSCTGVATDAFSYTDTIYVIKSPSDLLATSAVTPATCLASNGTITVSVPSGAGTAPFQYSINGGTLQNNNSFTGLASGTYSVFVRDASGACTSTLTVFVPFANPVNGTGVATAPTCAGASNGSLTVTPTNAVAPITYSLNGGPAQASPTFTGLIAGTYSITISDGNGCNRAIFVTVPAGTGNLTATVTPTAATCSGVSNGSITVTNPSGTAPHQYALGATGTFGASNTFTGLIGGTYIIRVRDAIGCITSFTVIVSNGAGITATASPTNTTCAGINNGVITANATSGTAPFQYSINGGPNQLSNIFSGLAPGTYSIRVTDANNCNVTITASVFAGAGLNATATTIATACSGVNNGSITVTPSNGTAPYSYTLDGGTAQGSNTFTNVSAGTHTVVVTDLNGCSRTLSVTVASGTGLNATFITTATTCSAISNGTITVTPTNGTAPYTYSLDGAAAQSSNSFSGVNSGNHTVLITDFTGCNRTLSINVVAGTVFSLSQTNTAASCSVATNGTATINTTGGLAPFSYAIDGGASQTSNIFNNLSVGVHNVVVTDGSGCTNNISFSIVAGAGISATNNTVAVSCNGASNGQINVTPSGGNAPYQYQLNTGAFGSSSNFTGLLAGTYNITVRDANGCTTTTTATVAQGANLAATSVVTNVSCNGSNNGNITITNTNGNSPYQYSLNGGVFQSSNVFNGLLAGSYTITLRDANNCTGTLNVSVAQPTTLNATVANTAVLCNGQNNGVITVSVSGGTPNYEYSINNGTTFQTANTFNVAAGSYNILVRDNNGCTTTLTTNVTEPNALTLSANATSASCNGGADGVITANAIGGVTPYTYSIDGVTFQSGNTFNVLAGSYTVTVKDANNCTSTRNIIVGLTSNIIVDTRADTTICESKSVVLTTTSNALSFRWSPILGLNDTLAQNPIATPLVTTKYYVTATLGSCTRIDSVTVFVNTAPIPDAGPGITICYGKNYTLQGSGGSIFSWTPTSSLSNPNIFNPIATPTTTTTYTLSTIDANGCASLVTDTVTVFITPPLVVSAAPDTTVVKGQPYQLNAVVFNPTISLNGYSYIWSPSFGLNNPSIQNPLATIYANTIYNVEVSTPEGCKGNASVLLQVLPGPDIFVPTIFTPNGDGINDVFKVYPVGIKEFHYLRIFNRWGQKVFETNNVAIGWNAFFKSAEQPIGAYIFNVEGVTDAGKVINKKGTFVLTR